MRQERLQKIARLIHSFNQNRAAHARNLRTFREIVRQVVISPQIEIDFYGNITATNHQYTTFNNIRGLSQNAINLLPVHSYKGRGGFDSEQTVLTEDVESKKETCVICMDAYEINNEVMVLPCFHQVHYSNKALVP